jgi:integrase
MSELLLDRAGRLDHRRRCPDSMPVTPRGNKAARGELRRRAASAGVRRRFAPHQLRHAHAVGMAREGVPLIVIQRQLGHSNVGITSVYLQGIDSGEIIETLHARRGADGSGQRITPALIDCVPRGAAHRAKR